VNDPWHQDTLEGLVATIDATKLGGGTAYVVVAVSSERLGGEVVGELRQRLGQVETLRVCTYVDPRSTFQRRLEEPRQEEFRTTIIQGLPTVLESERGKGLLGWLNFRRESFSRPGEAFVFVLTREAADLWAKEAPDLDRYTAHFVFEDWDDVVEAAERAAAKTELVGEDGKTRLRQAKERLQQARKLGGDFALGALLEVAVLDTRAGLYADAERALAEAWSLTEGHSILRGRVVLARAHLLLEQGHPDAALQALRSVDAASIDKLLMTQALGHTYHALGKLKESQSSFTSHPELVRFRTEDFQPSTLFYKGDVLELVDFVMTHARQHEHDQETTARVSLMAWLGRASRERGRPRRSIEIFDELRTAPGGQSARLNAYAMYRAEARWTADGPAAVAAILYDEEQRQRGWTAPAPVAELAYARGLAATTDEDARRHLEDAASRFRTLGLPTLLGEVQLKLARIDRLHGDLDRAAARIAEGFSQHVQAGYRPFQARDHTELAMIALGRHDSKTAREQALQALELIRACGTRLYEPAALVALAAAERSLGNTEAAQVHDQHWRRLVRGIDAKGLEAALERDAAWAAAITNAEPGTPSSAS
jgi:predicted negative regulator of RcsB-dependent stress response